MVEHYLVDFDVVKGVHRMVEIFGFQALLGILIS